MNFTLPPHRSLHDALAGRMLTGAIVEDGRLFLRLLDGTVRIDLATRDWSREKKRDGSWLTFSGWLLVRRVVQDAAQISFDVSGALFSARISARLVRGKWTLVLPRHVF